MIWAKDHFTYEMKHRLAWNSYDFEIKSVHCMMHIWNVNIFERDYNILFPTSPNSVGSHSHILESLPYPHHKLGEEKSFLESLKSQTIKVAATDMRYFARSKFSRSLVQTQNFSSIWQVVFKLGYVFCQER